MTSPETGNPIMDLERHLVAQTSLLNGGASFFWHRLRSEYALDAIRRLARARPTVLDVGAGAGIFGTHLREALPDGRYAFIEPLESLARDLRSRFGPDADWRDRSYGDADAVVVLDVLEHQEKDVLFLKDLAAKLRPRTILVITCPALDLLWSEWDVKLGHFRRYTLRSLGRVLCGAGLEILDSRYIFHAMVLPGLVRRFQKPSRPEFPEISDTLNRIIYRLGRIERALGSWLPFGSSVGAVCRTKPGD